MKVTLLKSSLVLGTLMLGLTAQAQKSSPAFEALCRVKAKESANASFRSCMSENKSAEIENIRKEYQQRLSAIKEEYEKELGRISGKTTAKASDKAATPSKATAVKSTSGDDESALLKNSILDDSKDSADSENQNLDSDSSEDREEIRETQIPKAPKYFESAGRDLQEKREPKEPQTPVKNQRAQTSAKFASSMNTKSKAILFNDLTEIPEPIPVEATNGGLHQ